MEMEEIEEIDDVTFTDGGCHTTDGTFIHTRFFKLWGSRRVCVLVHGAGRCAKMYDHIGKSLCSRGYSCLAYDHRYHGSSGGGNRNFEMESVKTLEDDLEYILRNLFPKTKFDHIFVVAHSMGSMVTWGLEIRTGLRKINPRIRGVVSLGTSFDIGHVPFVFSRILHPLWVNVWFPGFTKYRVFGQQTRGMDLSIRSEHFKKIVIKEDERKYENKSVLFCVIYYDYLMNYLRPNLDKITIPCRFVHGTADSRCPIDGVFYGLKMIPKSTDTSMKIFKDYYHEILLEDEFGKVVDDMCEWMEEKFPIVLVKKE